MDKTTCAYCKKDPTGICDKHFSQSTMQQFEDEQANNISSVEMMVDRQIAKTVA